MQTLINSIISWASSKADDAPAWIFTLSEPLADKDLSSFESEVTAFVESWRSHGEDPKGEFLIWQNQVIFMSSLHHPSGCGQDELHRQIKTIANKYGLIAYRGEKLVFAREGQVSLKVREGFDCNQLDPNDLWLNTGVSKVKSLKKDSFFRVPNEVF